MTSSRSSSLNSFPSKSWQFAPWFARDSEDSPKDLLSSGRTYAMNGGRRMDPLTGPWNNSPKRQRRTGDGLPNASGEMKRKRDSPSATPMKRKDLENSKKESFTD